MHEYIRTYFDVSVDQPIQFNVVIVFAKRIDQDLGHFQPSNIKAKLKGEKNVYFVKFLAEEKTTTTTPIHHPSQFIEK